MEQMKYKGVKYEAMKSKTFEDNCEGCAFNLEEIACPSEVTCPTDANDVWKKVTE